MLLRLCAEPRGLSSSNLCQSCEQKSVTTIPKSEIGPYCNKLYFINLTEFGKNANRIGYNINIKCEYWTDEIHNISFMGGVKSLTIYWNVIFDQEKVTERGYPCSMQSNKYFRSRGCFLTRKLVLHYTVRFVVVIGS